MKKNIKFIAEVFFFFVIALPVGVCFYIANEIFFMFKKLK
jgi:membrane protein insertase Oxa1/YidC/SpoIIIJ